MTHYDVLGVALTATRDEIVRAYRRLVLTEHPDVGGNGKKFLVVVEAYAVLKDPSARRAYDLELSQQQQQPVSGPPRPPRSTTWKPPRPSNFVFDQRAGTTYNFDEWNAMHYPSGPGHDNASGSLNAHQAYFDRLRAKKGPPRRALHTWAALVRTGRLIPVL